MCEKRCEGGLRENCGRKVEGIEEDENEEELRIGKREEDRAEEEERKRSWRKPGGVKAAMGKGNDESRDSYPHTRAHTLSPSPSTQGRHAVLPTHKTRQNISK
jgi:hypothetical protein